MESIKPVGYISLFITIVLAIVAVNFAVDTNVQNSSTRDGIVAGAETEGSKDIFESVFLASLSGAPALRPASSFHSDDTIVLALRTQQSYSGGDTLYPKVYRGEKLIADQGGIEIYSGEIEISNPVRPGTYVVRGEVEDELYFELPFTIQ